MTRSNRPSAFAALLVLGLAACALPAQGPSGATNQAPSTPKRVVAAIAGDPPTMHVIASRAFATFSIPGNDIITRLVLSNLSVPDEKSNLRPQLAEAVPSVENGLWKVEPDGSMETTWKVRRGAAWHDGLLLTADDLAFGLQVVRDRELTVFRDNTYDGILGAETAAPDLIIVKWKEPYIFADTLFGTVGWPFPKHLLEDTYANDKANFLQASYWSDEFVGTGPYKLKEFVKSTRIVLTANDAYLHGRPKIDEVEVRFILDPNVIVANLLSGAVDLTFGRVFPLSTGQEIRNQWQDGSVLVGGNFTRIHMEPQHVDPNPPIVGDPRFRRALMYGIDRQEMADTLQYGLVPIADSILAPDQPEYDETAPALVHYPYDPQKAAQGLEALGLRKGPDGLLRETGNQPLSLEVRVTSENPLSNKSILVVTDYWKQLGVDVNPVVIPTAQVQDREYLATFPTFHFRRQNATVAFLTSLLSRNAQLPANNYVGSNYARYMNPDFDAGVLKFFATIDQGQRMDVLRPLIRHISDDLVVMGLFYDTTVTVVNNRVKGVTAANEGWNVTDWNV